MGEIGEPERTEPLVVPAPPVHEPIHEPSPTPAPPVPATPKKEPVPV